MDTNEQPNQYEEGVPPPTTTEQDEAPEVVAEEPVVEEPVAEEPVAAEPVTEEPVVEEPVAEEPVAEEPVVEEPVTEEPVAEEPVAEEPVVEEPVTEEPVVEEPVAEEPVVEEPVTEEPVAEEPVVEEPVVEEPVVEEPVAEEPVVEESQAVDIPSQSNPSPAKSQSPEPSKLKPAPKAFKIPSTVSPSKSPGKSQQRDSVSRSPGRQGDLITRQAMMDQHASQCTERTKHDKERDAHRSHATSAIRTLGRVGKQEEDTIKEALRTMEEEDKAMFTKIPAGLMPRKAPKNEDRAMTAARAAQYRNDNYSVPPRNIPEDPRQIVNIKRPILPRNAPIPPNPLVTGKSHYAGMSEGNFTALENDPHYRPDPENNKRKQLAEKKDAILKSYATPHSPEALKRKKGYVYQEKPAVKVPKDYIPAVAQKLPDDHGDEARERRDKAEKAHVIGFKA